MGLRVEVKSGVEFLWTKIDNRHFTPLDYHVCVTYKKKCSEDYFPTTLHYPLSIDSCL